MIMKITYSFFKDYIPFSPHQLEILRVCKHTPVVLTYWCVKKIDFEFIIPRFN